MPHGVDVGTILLNQSKSMKESFALETSPCSGSWSTVEGFDGPAIDRKIHAAGWNFFFMAAEIKVMFFGAVGAAKIQSALRRIVAKGKPEHFNGLEVTAIVARHFLGVPYVTVSAHSRHMQKSCYLDSAKTRLSEQHAAESAGG
jgi:hypothetical protein